MARVKDVKISGVCLAAYDGTLTVPADLEGEDLVKYINEHRGEIPVSDLEWISEDGLEDYTAEDIREVSAPYDKEE